MSYSRYKVHSWKIAWPSTHRQSKKWRITCDYVSEGSSRRSGNNRSRGRNTGTIQHSMFPSTQPPLMLCMEDSLHPCFLMGIERPPTTPRESEVGWSRRCLSGIKGATSDFLGSNEENCRQKLRELEFEVGDMVYLKVRPYRRNLWPRKDVRSYL